jgi:hypothetical protein
MSLSRSLVLSFYSENSILIGLIDLTEVFLDRSGDYSAIPNKEMAADQSWSCSDILNLLRMWIGSYFERSWLVFCCCKGALVASREHRKARSSMQPYAITSLSHR